MGSDKRPVIPTWTEYQKRLPTDEEITQWFSNPNATGVAIVTGTLSRLVVLDIDEGADITGLHLPPTLTVKTGNGGWHHYYRFPEGRVIRNSAGVIGIHLDIRAEGGYVVAPPSLHPNANNYEWLDALSPSDLEIADIPQWLLEDLSSPNIVKKDFMELVQGVGEGRRNESAASLVGKLLMHIPQNEWQSIAWPLVEGWNSKNTPPLPPTEIRSVFESIATRELNGQVIPAKKERLEPLSVSDIFAMTFEPQPFLIENLVPEGGMTAFSGRANEGKGWITLHMAHCVATGKPVFGKFAVKQAAVLIIDEEAGNAEFHRRMIKFGIQAEDKIYLYSQQEFKVDSPDDLAHLITTAKEREVKLVIFDPFSAIHLKAENSADDMQRVMAALQQFNLAGIAVIFIHHHRKEHVMNKNVEASSGLRGSTILFTRPDSHIAIKKDSESEGGLKITVEQPKLRGGQRAKPFSVELKIDKETNRASFGYAGEIQEKMIKKEAAKEFILERLLGRQMTADEMIIEAQEVQIGKNSIEEALREMKAEGIVLANKMLGRGKKLHYNLPQIEEGLGLEPEPVGLAILSS